MPPEIAVSNRRGQVVLDARLGLVAQGEYAFSIDGVAEVAGVHKSTIYRK
jgi:AcrR family transcriptional regulator